MNIFSFKSKIWINICISLLLFVICVFATDSFAKERFRGDVPIGGTVSQVLTPPAAVTKKCTGVPVVGDDACPREDDSNPTQSPSRAGVTLPAPGGKKFTFAGLCSLTGRGNNACIAVVDCLENNGNCAITDCLKKPSLEECKQLCTADPTNFACAAFECAENPGRDCCAIVQIPECCDFFDILDDFNSCRRNPGATCCALIGDFGGDATFEQRCVNVIQCQQRADATCCNLFPESSQDCRAILGCVGLTTTTADAKMDSCCRLFPDNILCDIYDCKKRIDAGDGQGCCEMVAGVDLCAAFYDCKDALAAGLQSSASQACCNNPTFGMDLQACQALECINMLAQAVEDPGVMAQSGGSLEYCCSLVPNSETCQKLVACYRDPMTECCDLFSAKVPACAFMTCYSSFIGDTSTGGAYPSPACCDLLSNIPKCRLVLQCLNVPNASCCTLLGGSAPPICTALVACMATILDTGANFEDRAACCKLFPQEISTWCTDFFLCDANPDLLCCAATSPYTDSENCKAFLQCLIEPTPQCCIRYPNASDPALLPATLGCQIVLDCVKSPEYACCILPQLQKIPICANLIKCAQTGGIECCKLFPDIATDCTNLLQCYEDLVESQNTNNACCSALSATQLVGFDQCNDILACVADFASGTVTAKCCKLIPGDTYRAVCDAFFAGAVPTVVDCFTPGVFGGCSCPPNSPGGANMNETIF